MKPLVISALAIASIVGAACGPADRALAGEPIVLTEAQLDRVTAGSSLLPADQAAARSPIQAGPSNTIEIRQVPIPRSDGRPAEFIIITIGQKTSDPQ